MPARISLTGKRFGKLTVISNAPSAKGRTRSLCKCDCGKEKIIAHLELTSGDTRSCGCLRIIHGHARKRIYSKVYRAWLRIKSNCLNPNDHRFKDYGGRGISVCEEWKYSFSKFFAHVGNPPRLGRTMTLGRIDNNAGYFPGNVRWETQADQTRNTRRNKIYTVNGVTACLKDLCANFVISYNQTRKRISRGWTIQRAFFEPTHHPERTGRAFDV